MVRAPHAARWSLVAVFAGSALAGCQSASPPSASLDRSVIAGRTTFVDVPGGHGTRQVVALAPDGQKVCPDCQAVAADYFKTGMLKTHACRACGAPIEVAHSQMLSPIGSGRGY
ncbi:MAG: hypothetical protein JWO31_1116 [Phycisphaerales bacterium]|nr:hypothetical protein [Phycisphaerales bacterium]